MNTQDSISHRPEKVSNVVKVLHWGDDIPHIVALIGSYRFPSHFANAARMYSMEGHVVLAPHVYTNGDESLKRAQQEELHELALKKIQMADVVYVINPHNIMSEDVRKQIEFAESLGRMVRYLETPASK